MNVNDIIFIQQDTLWYYVPPITPTNKVIALDIDWTVAYGCKQLISKDPDDIYILPYRKEKLEEMIDLGYTIAFFTNQHSTTKQEITKRLGRITTFLQKLDIPSFAFIATGKAKNNIDDIYRKPEIGMWTKLLTFLPKLEDAFFVGDALGRPQDFSDSDRKFAENIGIQWISPEDFFGTETEISLPEHKSMVLMVGMPGSGKSTYAHDVLKPQDYIVVSQDTLKTKKRVISTAIECMKRCCNIVIDNTNPTQEGREEFYNLAEQYGYSASVIYLIRDGHGFNSIRETGKVPDIAYHMFFKKFEQPTEDNTPEYIKLYKMC